MEPNDINDESSNSSDEEDKLQSGRRHPVQRGCVLLTTPLMVIMCSKQLSTMLIIKHVQSKNKLT
eukprot:15348499-Ditylum_brightwellii.AAC.1